MTDRGSEMPLAGEGDRISKPRVLHAYLLGRVGFDEVSDLQRQMAEQVAADRSRAALLLCDHPFGVTVGRSGSVSHLRVEPDELRQRRWGVRWVPRGGGCMLFAPGQVAVYPVLALDSFGMNLKDYLDALQGSIATVLNSLSLPARTEPDRPGVWVGERRVAHVGVAVRDWVTSFGAVINYDVNLKCFREVWCDGEPKPMTSIVREQRTRIRLPTVRQRLLEEFSRRFGFERVSLFHHHPLLQKKATPHAAVTGRC